MATKCPKCHSDNPDTQRFCGECGTQLIPAEEISAPTETLETPKGEFTRGTTLANRYEFIEELGKGGMGSVYKVFDKKVKEEVALKLLKSEIAADEKTIERFSNELKLARKIIHKNIGRMYELMEEEGTHFITMEYVPGEDLKSFIRRARQLTVGAAVSIAKQVCEGLAEAHKLGVVHRDLKPRNIMIDKEGNARIMDFGIARSLRAKGITAEGTIIGTAEYMSPEQVEGKEVDQRSDIYSLGIILYEMLIGKVPFEGDKPLSIVYKHKHETPQDPKKLNAQIPNELSQLILTCLEKNREKRYQSAEEALSELKKIEKGIPITEREIPKKKPIMSKEITLTFGLKKLLIPALVVIAIAISAVIIWQVLRQKQPVTLQPRKLSVAVLPFEDLSPNKDQEYFCDGLADELINRLTNIESLRVPARTSAFSFKGKGLDIREIGEKLEVENVLEGSVRKEEKKLRITVQLVNVKDGSPLWSEKYERDEVGIFALQDEISLAVVDKLKLKLLGGEREKLMKRHTENLEAYNLYLKGRYFSNRRTEEDVVKGIEYFRQAIENDPTYALAYAGLADAFTILGAFGLRRPKEVFPKAKAEAKKALEIDDMLAEAHASLGFIIKSYDWDWLAAEREFKRALELNPNSTTTHHSYGIYLSHIMGRFDEAITEFKRAQELDPLSFIINATIGTTLTRARRYDEAIEQLRKTIEMDPNFLMAHVWLGIAYCQKEMWEEGIAEYQKAVTMAGDMTLALGCLGLAYGLSGQTDEALKVLNRLNELSKEKYVPPLHKAWIYMGLGEKDKAFEHLEKSYLERDPMMDTLTGPFYDSLRSDPRFTALLKKMGLE